ncbi:hypothetical protein KXV85_003024, partial [Aspergillus fumigatus]
PSEVSDNGQFTVMRFPNQRELPAFFVVNPDGSEAIASFDVRDEYVVLHGVYRTIRLRRGLESSEPRGFNKMAANDHDNAPHGDNIISQGETVENRPLASEPVPDPEDIERQSERQAKIAALPNRSIDPKKAVVLAAVACGAIVLGFSTIDAMRSDPTEKAEKAEKPDERQLANYDP